MVLGLRSPRRSEDNPKCTSELLRTVVQKVVGSYIDSLAFHLNKIFAVFVEVIEPILFFLSTLIFSIVLVFEEGEIVLCNLNLVS